MTEQNQPGIRFSLEEAVWFRKSEEISELISISLEPNITIQDLDEFVSIRGALKMYGEYIRDDSRDREEEDHHYYFAGQKFVTVLDSRESEVSEFHYAFPIDITVPKTRVVNFEDLNIVIDSFDYTIPEPSCLKLTTDVEVTGVEAENATVFERNDLVEDDEDNEPELDEVLIENRVVPLKEEENDQVDHELNFTAQATKVEDRNDEENTDTEIPISITSSFDDQFVEIPQTDRLDEDDEIKEIPSFSNSYEQNQNQLTTDENVLSFERIPSNEEDRGDVDTAFKFFPKEQIKLQNDETQVELQEEPFHETLARNAEDKEKKSEEEQPTLQFIRDEANEVLESVEETNPGEPAQEQVVVALERDHEDEVTKDDEEQIISQITSEDQEIVEEAVDVRKEDEQVDEVDETESNIIDLDEVRSEKNINYQTQSKTEEASISLTEFLARKDDNPVTQMKVYIVQDQDNLNVIAEKYNVTVSQLLRINQLEPHQDVYEGQVLNIPTKQKTHS